MTGLKIKNLFQSGILILALGLSLVAPIIVARISSAATATTTAQGLEISPPLIELEVDPGQNISTNIKLRNVTQSALVVSSSREDFVAKDEVGNPRILLEPGEESPYSLKEWVTESPDIRIIPKEQKTIPVKINVPENASPGGHYGVIRFTATPEGPSANQVALSASIGTLVLLRVSGDIKEEAEIVEFYAAKSGNKGTFFEYGPLSFVERIKASGNVHIKPIGEVIVKNVFGKEIAKLKVNDPPGNILPSSIRRFEQKLNKNRLFGRYSATLTLSYGQDKQLTQTIKFWVIPYKLLLVVVLALVILFILTRFGLKRYKRRILRDASEQQRRPHDDR